MEGEVSPLWDGTTCIAFFAGEIMRAHKAALGGGQGHRGGAERQESEQRGKWRWRVCQGSATYCTTNPSTPPERLRPVAHVAQDTAPLLSLPYSNNSVRHGCRWLIFLGIWPRLIQILQIRTRDMYRWESGWRSIEMADHTGPGQRQERC